MGFYGWAGAGVGWGFTSFFPFLLVEMGTKPRTSTLVYPHGFTSEAQDGL